MGMRRPLALDPMAGDEGVEIRLVERGVGELRDMAGGEAKEEMGTGERNADMSNLRWRVQDG